MRILFASTNTGKLSEAREVAARAGVEIVAVSEIAAGPVPEVDESASTYSGNAKLKADAFFAWSGLPSLADDAGLEVEALGGEPGVRSARYAGEPVNPERNIDKLLSALAGKDNRNARFVCYLCARLTGGGYITAEGFLPGAIARERQGEGGFGYDSVFVPEGYDRTLAELKSDPKLREQCKTHRILGLEKIFPLLSRA